MTSKCRAKDPATCRVHGGSHYATLNISLDSSAEDIHKAFRKNARLHHPDTGGTVQQFQKLQLAYSVLSVPSKKANYDLGLKAQEEAELYANGSFNGQTSSGTGNQKYPLIKDYALMKEYSLLEDELNSLIMKQERCKELLRHLREKHKASPNDAKVNAYILKCMSEFKTSAAQAEVVNSKLNKLQSDWFKSF